MLSPHLLFFGFHSAPEYQSRCPFVNVARGDGVGSMWQTSRLSGLAETLTERQGLKGRGGFRRIATSDQSSSFIEVTVRPTMPAAMTHNWRENRASRPLLVSREATTAGTEARAD